MNATINATINDTSIVAPELGTASGQHFYEAPNSVTEYLDPKHRDAFPVLGLPGHDSIVEVPVDRATNSDFGRIAGATDHGARG